ncbi:unnamed protein product [Brugia pahangi]|uniref:Uncharacterized protein n=1 Tax=Brugia pahangi TaxID=6280 RepID=A0A0N4T3B4_BRUPA|nr:unnamed protein product [Brugia pahangi]
MNILCTVEDSSIFAWKIALKIDQKIAPPNILMQVMNCCSRIKVDDSMSIIDDARMQKMNGLRQTINSKYYQKLLNLMCMQHSSFSIIYNLTVSWINGHYKLIRSISRDVMHAPTILVTKA